MANDYAPDGRNARPPRPFIAQGAPRGMNMPPDSPQGPAHHATPGNAQPQRNWAFNVNAPEFSPHLPASMSPRNAHSGGNVSSGSAFTAQSIPPVAPFLDSRYFAHMEQALTFYPMLHFQRNQSMSTTAATQTHSLPQAMDRRERSITPPVKQPSPSEQYLQQAAQEPKICTSPRPLLVILDLNGTLVYRKHKKLPPNFASRFGLRQFLHELVEKYHVMVWSSSRPDTVHAICNMIFTAEELRRIVVLWGRDKFDLTPRQYNSKLQVYKELHKVWASPEVQARYPGNNQTSASSKKSGGKSARNKTKQKPSTLPEAQRWNQSNTILIDDSKLKAISEPYNIIEIPELTKDHAGKANEATIFTRVLARLDLLSRYDDVTKVLHKWSERVTSGEGKLLEIDVGAVGDDEEDGGISLLPPHEAGLNTPNPAPGAPKIATQPNISPLPPQTSDPEAAKLRKLAKNARKKAAKAARKAAQRAAKEAGSVSQQVKTSPKKSPKGRGSHQAAGLTTENLALHLQNSQPVEAPSYTRSASSNSLLDRLEEGLGFKMKKN